METSSIRINKMQLTELWQNKKRMLCCPQPTLVKNVKKENKNIIRKALILFFSIPTPPFFFPDLMFSFLKVENVPKTFGGLYNL